MKDFYFKYIILIMFKLPTLTSPIRIDELGWSQHIYIPINYKEELAVISCMLPRIEQSVGAGEDRWIPIDSDHRKEARFRPFRS